MIPSAFPSKALLHTSHPSSHPFPNVEQDNKIFNAVRGDFFLWGAGRENANFRARDLNNSSESHVVKNNCL